MAVGLAFTALQVATVSAQSGSGAALTIGDERCTVANEMRDTRCPNYRTTDEGKADTADDNASAHKVGQERWDPAMGGKGTKTMNAGNAATASAIDDKVDADAAAAAAALITKCLAEGAGNTEEYCNQKLSSQGLLP